MNYSHSFKQMLNHLASSNNCKVSRIMLMLNNASSLSRDLNHITMRGNMISYLPEGREHIINENGRWAREGRQEGKVGRIAKRILGELYDDHCLTDRDIENFSNYVYAYVGENGDGENDNGGDIRLYVCNGDFIPKYYNKDAYNENVSTGNLYDSCMKNRGEEYFELYSKNPNQVSMLVAKDQHNLIIGRALIWKDSNGTRYMDTIYASTDIRQMFISFAKNNQIRYKSSQSCHHHRFDMLGNDFVTEGHNVYIHLQHPDSDSLDCYPYMDSLYYMSGNTISNVAPCEEYYELRSTGGDREWISCDDNEVECIVTGDMINEDCAYYVDYRFEGRLICGYAHEEEVVTDAFDNRVLYNHTVSVGDDYYLRDSDRITYDEWRNDYIHIEDAVFDEDGNAMHQDDAVRHADTDEWIHEGDARDVNGKWYHINDTVYNEESQSYVLSSSYNNK